MSRRGSSDSRARAEKYTSRIIKAGALIGDTKTLLLHWDVQTSPANNISRLRQENLFGKSSRSRVKDILAIFRQRYLAEPSVTSALIYLLKCNFPSVAFERLLYFHAARADRLLRDSVTDILGPMFARGLVDIEVQDFQRTLSKWVQDERTTGNWSETTIIRVSQGLLSTLRDFGVLQGAVNKRITPPYLPVESFAYIMIYFKQHQPSGSKLIDHPDWKLFFLAKEGVERLLFEAHQRELLEYHVAGSVTRLTFPADTLEAYANVLAQR
jgi:hypothetical protein